MKAKGSKAQSRAKLDLHSSLKTAMRIYGPAKEMCKFDGESFEETTYQPNVAAKIVGLAFLSAAAAWEDFVANIFLGYLSGYPAPNGESPKLRAGKAENKRHALLILAGEPNSREAERRMRWSSFRWVQSVSEIHFKKDNPFLAVSSTDIEWLDLSVIIRNRVAHNSEKAKKQFKDSFNRLVGSPKDAPLPNGFSPGWLLNAILQSHPKLKALDSDDHYWGDLFEGYVNLWQKIADTICPGDIKNS